MQAVSTLDEYRKARDAGAPTSTPDKIERLRMEIEAAPCPTCKGEGRVEVKDSWTRKRVTHKPCRKCRETGKVASTAPASRMFLDEVAEHTRAMIAGPGIPGDLLWGAPRRLVNTEGKTMSPCSPRCGALSGPRCLACGASAVGGHPR